MALGRIVASMVLLAGAAASRPVAQDAAPSPAEIAAAIDQLGSLDSHDVRMEAGRTLRRAPSASAVRALTEAARSHQDEYVRYRALVLLSGFAPPDAGDLMRRLMADHNDRIRTVVFGWFEHHPDPRVLPALVSAMADERSEFVRPALTRAVAVQGDDPRAREALVPLVARGEDFFRGAVVEALGDYRAAYALPAIEEVARIDGPLQDDAISAIGKIGHPRGLPLLVELQETVRAELQPTLSAAICLLGLNCEAHKSFIMKTLAFAAGSEDHQPLLRGAVHALGMLAVRGHEDALAALLSAGAGAAGSAQAPIALGVGLVALRDPAMTLRVLTRAPHVETAVLLLRDAFDMLSEDFEEERFFVAIRRAYWATPDGAPERRIAEALIRALEF